MSPASSLRFWTVGHSSHAWEHFSSLLAAHAIDVLVDTRSAPHSRYAPHFDRDALKDGVQAAGRRYLWLGDVVGGRPREADCYDDAGHVLYGRVARLPSFLEAVERLERGAREFRVALLCAEEDPAHCHRRLLVSRVLLDRGHEVTHIRGDASLDRDDDVARKSGKPLREPQTSLFGNAEEDAWRSSAPIGKPAARSIFG